MAAPRFRSRRLLAASWAQVHSGRPHTMTQAAVIAQPREEPHHPTTGSLALPPTTFVSQEVLLQLLPRAGGRCPLPTYPHTCRPPLSGRHLRRAAGPAASPPHIDSCPRSVCPARACKLVHTYRWGGKAARRVRQVGVMDRAMQRWGGSSGQQEGREAATERWRAGRTGTLCSIQ